ncbi:DUF397 domain-containing protein [Streptomyces sp. NPDC048483]|uniref:DUF397 domain-containing protein n=1 Tax=Streptomyces sp. NPDC048483 TaxID=3154927 RepID=UPI003419D305
MTQGTVWQKSSFSGGGDSSDCVELAAVNGSILLRENDTPSRMLSATPDEIAAFVRHVQGEAK